MLRWDVSHLMLANSSSGFSLVSKAFIKSRGDWYFLVIAMAFSTDIPFNWINCLMNISFIASSWNDVIFIKTSWILNHNSYIGEIKEFTFLFTDDLLNSSNVMSEVISSLASNGGKLSFEQLIKVLFYETRLQWFSDRRFRIIIFFNNNYYYLEFICQQFCEHRQIHHRMRMMVCIFNEKIVD